MNQNTNETVFVRGKFLVNGHVAKGGDGKWKLNDGKVKVEGDELKVKVGDQKLKIDGDEIKIKANGVKAKSEDGEIKVKTKDERKRNMKNDKIKSKYGDNKARRRIPQSLNNNINFKNRKINNGYRKAPIIIIASGEDSRPGITVTAGLNFLPLAIVFQAERKLHLAPHFQY